ncbi:MAG: ParB/RepB/Spo0J family partition protein [Candidatus Liptonbacteria bacterium]|nr:ParB/RepB/Spo0J family partition protein [Candidatus Liptonbacteria bacterium]
MVLRPIASLLGKNGMLGRGLESLIPPHSPDNLKNEGRAPQEMNLNNSTDFASMNLQQENTRLTPPEIPSRDPFVGGHMKPAYESGMGKSIGKARDLEVSPVFHIETAKITPNPEQPRRNFDPEALHDLARSIAEFGVLQPLLVSKVEHETESGQDVSYQLIAGERRLRAAEIAGLERVPVIIRKPSPPKEQLEMAIIENLQREDLNPIEAARAFSRLQDEFRLTQREIATRLGKSRESIANTMRLLSLPTVVQEALTQGKLNESQGRMLLMVSSPRDQEKLFDEILKSNLSVRELRNKIKQVAKMKEEAGSAPYEMDDYEDPEIIDLKEQLELFFGAPVTIKKSGGSGKIMIDFYSPEELKGIALKLAKNGAEGGDDMDEGYSDDFVI